MPIIAAVVLVSMVTGGPISAQGFQTGRLDAKVIDVNGEAAAGATVSVVHLEKGFTRKGYTDESARFNFTALPVGPYAVRASLALLRGEVNDIALEADHTTMVIVPLIPVIAEESIATFAPGVTGLNVHGALVAETSYRLDGV